MLPNKNENLLLDDRWLRLAEFWANNRERFRKALLAIVIAIEAVLLLYSAWILFDMYVLNARRDATIIAGLTQFTDYTRLHPLVQPQPLSTPVAVVLPESASAGKYDVLLRFSNPNPNWYADVTYAAGEQIGTARVLHNQERLVVVQGAANSLSGLPSINIVDTDWHRIRNVAEIERKTPNILIENVNYTATSDNPGRVSFNLVNDSIFNYWEINVSVALLQGSRAVAARQIQLNELLAGESREVLVNFFGGVGGITDVLVVPFVNVVDPGIFMDIEAPSIQF